MMMKPKLSPSRAAAASRRPTGASRHDDDEIVILLPDLHVLRVIARSMLLAAALLSFPFLRATIVLACGPGPTPAESEPKWVDNPFALRMLVADLKREGLFNPELRNLFVGDPGSRAHFLKANGMDLMSPEFKKMFVDDSSVDFVLAGDGDKSLGFVDRVLKVGGIVALRLSTTSPICLPMNYRIVYIRRFESTIVAIKKISHVSANGNAGEYDATGLSGRRLLSAGKKNGKFGNGIEDLEGKIFATVKMLMNGMVGYLNDIGVLGVLADSIEKG